MSVLIAAAAGSQVLNSYFEYENQQDQASAADIRAKWQESQLQIKQGFLELMGEEATIRGDKAARQYKKQVSKFAGRQRAAIAGQGIQVDSGTASDLQTQTGETGALDVLTIKNNAWRQAFGYEQAAMTAGFQAEVARLTGEQGVASIERAKAQTLVTGGVRAAGSAAQTYSQLKS